MPGEIPGLRPPPRHVLADLFGNYENEGHTEETALATADDVVHALKIAGYEIVPTRSTAPAVLRDRLATALAGEASASTDTQDDRRRSAGIVIPVSAIRDVLAEMSCPIDPVCCADYESVRGFLQSLVDADAEGGA